MKRRILIGLVAVLVAALAGCSAQSPTPAPPSPTSNPGATVATTEPTGTTGPTIGPATSTAPATTPTVPPTATPRPTATPIPGPTVTELIGQKLMVAMSGRTPSADLLGRVRRGEVGGVILFGSNISSAAQLTSLTKKLQAAATDGGQPPLLISTDQEGGSVKRVPWIAPTQSPPEMGSNGTASNARSQGVSTGAGLVGLGVNLDLAPVADVPASTSSFMYQQGRTWSFSASTTETVADAFAKGLESAGELPAMKHFPGLGYAVENTDRNVVTITASTSQLDPGLDAYRGAITQDVPMVMLSNAWYTAWDASSAAGWSRAIGTTLLRDQLGFEGVTITDSLNGIGSAMGVSPTTLAVRAAKAGTDMILLTGSEASTSAAFATLLADAENGTLSRSLLATSYDRIVALKHAWLDAH